MNKKIIISVMVIGLIAIIIVALNNKNSAPDTVAVDSNQNNLADNTGPIAQPQEITPSEETNSPETVDQNVPIKEFTMTSFYEIVDGQPKPQYSLKEITVNKGDLVRIKITVTKGMHDFKIDEYNVYADTQPNQPMTVEFTAAKAGEFIYYCTKPGHRQNGHWGTLKVLDK